MKKTGKDLVVGDYIYVLDRKFNTIRNVRIIGIEIHGYHFENAVLTDKIKDYTLTFKLINVDGRYIGDGRCIIGSENFEEERGLEYNAFIYKDDAIKRVEKIIDLQIEELLKYKGRLKPEK